VYRVPGTLFHENSLSMYLCMVTPALLAAALSDWPRWLKWFSGLACGVSTMLVVMTLSRAGIPTFAFVMAATAFFCTEWRITFKKLMIVVATCAGAALLLVLSWDALIARFSQASLREEYLKEDAVETRGVYWRIVFAISEQQPYGVGLNNWSYAVSKTYGPQLGYLYHDYDAVRWDPDKDKAEETNHAPPAHSLAVITWGELGLPGLCIFGLLWLRWFQVGASFLRHRLDPDPMHRLGIGFLFGTCGLFIQSITEWTYRQTSIMFTFHVMMGALASLYYAKRFVREAAREEMEDVSEIEVEATPIAVSAIRSPR
jgi:O-antigen ligase